MTVANFNNDGLLDFAISGLLANSVPATMAYGYTTMALQVLTADTGFTNYTNNAMITSCKRPLIPCPSSTTILTFFFIFLLQVISTAAE